MDRRDKMEGGLSWWIELTFCGLVPCYFISNITPALNTAAQSSNSILNLPEPPAHRR